MSRTRVYVELDPSSTRVIRIFTAAGLARIAQIEGRNVTEWPRLNAKESIRRQVFERANKECEDCCRPISWGQMHLHEKIFRSHGGEVSLDNCMALCYRCHNGSAGARHPQLQWS